MGGGNGQRDSHTVQSMPFTLTRECSHALPSTTKIEFWIKSPSSNRRLDPSSHFSKFRARIVLRLSGSMVKISFPTPSADDSYVVDHLAYLRTWDSRYVLLAIALRESQRSVDLGTTNCAGLHPCKDAKARSRCAEMSDRIACTTAATATAQINSKVIGLWAYRSTTKGRILSRTKVMLDCVKWMWYLDRRLSNSMDVKK